MKGKSKPCMCKKNMQTSHRNAQTGFTPLKCGNETTYYFSDININEQKLNVFIYQNILLLLIMLIYFYTHMAVFPDKPGIKIIYIFLVL